MKLKRNVKRTLLRGIDKGFLGERVKTIAVPTSEQSKESRRWEMGCFPIFGTLLGVKSRKESFSLRNRVLGPLRSVLSL